MEDETELVYELCNIFLKGFSLSNLIHIHPKIKVSIDHIFNFYWENTLSNLIFNPVNPMNTPLKLEILKLFCTFVLKLFSHYSKRNLFIPFRLIQLIQLHGKNIYVTNGWIEAKSYVCVDVSGWPWSFRRVSLARFFHFDKFLQLFFNFLKFWKMSF